MTNARVPMRCVTERLPRPLTWVVGVVLVAMLSACQSTPWVPPEPDLVLSVSGAVTTPEPRASLDVPAGEERWIRLDVEPGVDSLPALLVVELQGPGGAVPHVDLRDERGRLLAAARSPQRYGRQIGALVTGVSAGQDVAASQDGQAPWSCIGTCVADRHRSGTYYVSVRNTTTSDASFQTYAYVRAQWDPFEPNDGAAAAAPYTLAFDGDGPEGAIEYPGDVDAFRLGCAAGFAGGDTGFRLTLSSSFVGRLALDADGDVRAVGERSAPLPCGSIVTVRALDASAGPAAASGYRLEAERAPLYAIDAVAQSRPTQPSALGRVTLAPGETALARLRFGSSSARLRYVEAVGVSGVSADGRVLLELRDPSGSIGFSTSRERFASGADVLAAPGWSDAIVSPTSIGVLNGCLGPCVLSRYRAETLVARLTNTSGQSVTIDVYAYGGPEFDENEPNETAASATDFPIGATGGDVTGAIERIGDVDVFRLVCSASFPYDDVFVTLESSFPGALVLRRSLGSVGVGPGGTLEAVPCGSTIRVETDDGSAGPSASSFYVLRAE